MKVTTHMHKMSVFKLFGSLPSHRIMVKNVKLRIKFLHFEQKAIKLQAKTQLSLCTP